METLGSGSGSGSTRRSNRPERKPFSDITNNCSSSSSLKLKSTSVPEPEPSDPKHAPPSTSGREDDGVPELPELGPSTSSREDDSDQENPPVTAKPNSNRDFTGSCNYTENNHEIEISTVYTRRMTGRRKNKEISMEPVPTLSCPPLGKRRSTDENMRLKANDVDLNKSFSVPHGYKKKKTYYKVPEPIQRLMLLPQDFVTKQRAYFAEIDAYELPEEEEIFDGDDI